MSRKNQRPLADRVTEAADAALAARDYASPLHVFLHMGWLNGSTVRDWQFGRTDCLESIIQANPLRVSEALSLLQSWAQAKGLSASEAAYIARTPQQQMLKFGRSGDPAVEQAYRTHWLSAALPESKRHRLVERASRPPELVVILPLKSEWKCHRCGGSGDFLIMENPGPACLTCVGLGDLEFLPAGDALLTRRAKAKSLRRAVVVRFARSRRRYERQGLLVERRALKEAQREIEKEKRSRSAG